MTNLLEKAIAEISKLPPADQDRYAKLLFAELESDKKWSTTFAATFDKFGSLAKKAAQAFYEGRDTPLKDEKK
jgi:hypothetical protein